MKTVSLVSAAFAAIVGFSGAAALHAATDVKTPSSVKEEAPDKTGKSEKGKAGEATMPKKADPSSVSESAPDKTGKEKAAAKQRDSKDMPNPKSPSSVSESKPSSPQK